jgi:hypothetical protein
MTPGEQMNNKTSEIIYVGNTAFINNNLEESSAEKSLDGALASLQFACQNKFIESSKAEGSYKFTLIIERMDLPCTPEDWNVNPRVLINKD